MLCDFHIHSQFSDGQLTIPQLIDLYGKNGFGAIAITDHLCENSTFLGKSAQLLGRTLTTDNFDQYLQILRCEAERAWDQYRMIVLPGYEVTKNSFNNHRSAHFLAIGITELIPAETETVAALRAIRSHGGITVAAHPVSTGSFEPQTYHLWSRREELAPEFDAWEVASGSQLFQAVLHSGLPMLASSDLHIRRHLNSWKTVLKCERHPDAILDAIRQQQVEFVFFEEKRESYNLWQNMNIIPTNPLSQELPKLSLSSASSIIVTK